MTGVSVLTRSGARSLWRATGERNSRISGLVRSIGLGSPISMSSVSCEGGASRVLLAADSRTIRYARFNQDSYLARATRNRYLFSCDSV
jgi:hypothetical protein